MGKSATHAVVFAQLYTPGGQCHGLHSFVVQVGCPARCVRGEEAGFTPGTFGSVWRHFHHSCGQGRTSSISCFEQDQGHGEPSSDAQVCPTCTPRNNCPAPNIRGADVERPWAPGPRASGGGLCPPSGHISIVSDTHKSGLPGPPSRDSRLSRSGVAAQSSDVRSGSGGLLEHVPGSQTGSLLPKEVALGTDGQAGLSSPVGPVSQLPRAAAASIPGASRSLFFMDLSIWTDWILNEAPLPLTLPHSGIFVL